MNQDAKDNLLVFLDLMFALCFISSTLQGFVVYYYIIIIITINRNAMVLKYICMQISYRETIL